MKKIIKITGWSVLCLFAVMNILAAVHAYKFTHFGKAGARMEQINLTFGKRLQLLFTGANNPRPVNTTHPKHPYQTINIQSNVLLACWHIPALQAKKGTVILFHGYTSNKSELINRAENFVKNGYDCLLVDFMGSGGSGGNQTTIGFKEACEVRDCYNYVRSTGESNIYLYGASLGAVAIMKSICDDQLTPKGIILDCPFGTMYETVVARFKLLKVPAFPLAPVLLFWGSVENGFWGFNHNPTEYAKCIQCPVLLQWGAKDDKVSRKEIDAIYSNIQTNKRLIIYHQGGHDNYLEACGQEWERSTLNFICAL